LEEAMSQLNLEPLPATFEKPEDDKRQHLKALFLKGFVDGKPVTKMLVDGGAAVNIMPYVMLRKLGKSQVDLTKIEPADALVYSASVFKYAFVIFSIGRACRYACARDIRNHS